MRTSCLAHRLLVVACHAVAGLRTTTLLVPRRSSTHTSHVSLVQKSHQVWRGCSSWKHRTMYSARKVQGLGHGDAEDSSHETAERREKRLARAKGAALGYIGRRSHSRKELEKKMLDRGHEPDVIGEALDRMEDLGLQDDGEYAAIFARSKWRQSKWSPRRIQMELKRRGVEDGMIDAALESVFGVEKDIQMHVDGAENIQEAMELIEAAKRQYQSYGSANISKDAKKRRLIGWLQRRGFTWDTVRSVIQSIDET